ncbi:MAG: TPM domain-containing protein, partial [Desulfosarcina sp.]
LYRTRDATGVLLFISVFERKVWLLADKGIHQIVGQDEWDRLVDRITGGIRKGQAADAICDAVGQIATLLQTYFPVKPDDTDELENLILGNG